MFARHAEDTQRRIVRNFHARKRKIRPALRARKAADVVIPTVDCLCCLAESNDLFTPSADAPMRFLVAGQAFWDLIFRRCVWRRERVATVFERPAARRAHEAVRVCGGRSGWLID